MGLVMLGMFHPQNNRGVDQFLYCYLKLKNRLNLVTQGIAIGLTEAFINLS